MSIYHEAEECDVLLLKRQRHLKAKLQFMEDTPSWFERRLMEETGLTEDDLDTIEATGSPGESGHLPAAQLDALESFLLRWEAGAITEVAGQVVIAAESPYASKTERAAAKPSEPRTNNHRPPETMSHKSIIQRWNALEKPRGFIGRFCKQFGFSPSTLSAIMRNDARDATIEKFQQAITAAESGGVGLDGRKAAAIVKKSAPKHDNTAPTPERGLQSAASATVQIPRELLPLVINTLRSQMDAIQKQISALENLTAGARG